MSLKNIKKGNYLISNLVRCKVLEETPVSLLVEAVKFLSSDEDTINALQRTAKKLAEENSKLLENLKIANEELYSWASHQCRCPYCNCMNCR